MSFVPLFGIVISARKPSSANILGCRASSLFFAIYAIVWSSGGDASLMFLTLTYAIFFVTVGATLFSQGKIPFENVIATIPSLETLWTALRSVPRFLFESVKAAFGKISELSFVRVFTGLHARDEAFETVMDKAFSDDSFAFSPKLAALPVVNLIFLPRLLSSRPYRYAIAAGQGIAITFTYIALVYVFGFSNPYQIYLLPAIALVL